MSYYEYTYIPKESIEKHNFCLYMYDIYVSLLFKSKDDYINNIQCVDENLNLKRKIFMSLLEDFLNFTLEALKSSEKGKLNVSFSLLRKPFKDNLLYLEWLVSDSDELLSYVVKGEINSYEVGKMRKANKIKPILNEVMLINPYNKAFENTEDDFIYNLRYNYNSPIGMELRWNSSNHLITQAPQIRTKTFNHIFSTSTDAIASWNYLYTKLPILFLYTLGVLLVAYEKLFEEITEITKVFNDVLILSKLTHITNQPNSDLIMDYINYLKNVSYVCDNCNYRTDLNGDVIRGFLENNTIKCTKCEKKLDMAQYYFI